MSYRGRGRGGYNNTYNRNFSGQQSVDNFVTANSVPVEILGWNGASPTDCVNFISRKCRIVVSNPTVDNRTGVLKGYVKSSQEADDLVKWSGVKFAGQSLRITKLADANSVTTNFGGNPNSNNTIELITEFLKTRYQPDIKMLNLAGVKQDPILTSKGFFATISTTSKFFPALVKIAKDLKLEINSVDMSNNDLSDLQTISSLAFTFPQLKNLSLLNNNLSRLRSFESWKNKLKFLRELILVGNPIVNSTSPQDLHTLKIELMRIFPRLVVLNGEIIRNEQALVTNLTLPFEPSQAMFFQDDQIRQISTNFIANYFKFWDTNRQELMVLYQNESQFSMQVDSAHPHSTDSSYNNQINGTDFGYYLPQSRNLTRVSSAKSRVSRVATGQAEIFKLFLQLPKSRHELVSKPNLFSMESYRFPRFDGIMVTLHGIFEELAPPENTEALNSSASGPKNRFGNHKNKKVPLSNKSFDRAFVIIPGPNGSMVVASDLLLIRPGSASHVWETPGAAAATAATAASAATTPVATTPTPGPAMSESVSSINQLPPEVRANLNPIQQEVLAKVLLETKLNLQYAIMLGEQSNWDYQQCIINFKNSEASLPRDAYV